MPKAHPAQFQRELSPMKTFDELHETYLHDCARTTWMCLNILQRRNFYRATSPEFVLNDLRFMSNIPALRLLVAPGRTRSFSDSAVRSSLSISLESAPMSLTMRMLSPRTIWLSKCAEEFHCWMAVSCKKLSRNPFLLSLRTRILPVPSAQTIMPRMAANGVAREHSNAAPVCSRDTVHVSSSTSEREAQLFCRSCPAAKSCCSAGGMSSMSRRAAFKPCTEVPRSTSNAQHSAPVLASSTKMGMAMSTTLECLQRSMRESLEPITA
mmetsp:Transcript_78076/g.143553  ORF Transcript_78076/g.143553 Transcript_78076/m.143553 type:complete len:267 (-) Transcript_78076:4-804(-)